MTLAASAFLLNFAPSSAFAAEHMLLGIKTFSPIGIVLGKFGDPTFILSGTQIATVEYGGGKPTLENPTDGGAGVGAAGAVAGGGQFQPPSAESPFNSDTANPEPGAAVAAQDPFDPLYDSGSRYYYDKTSKGLIFEFVSTSAGRVVEIKLYGYHSSYKTSLGIGLGSNYEQIVLKYGYPEQTINEQDQQYGDILTLIYTQKAHVAFRLVRNKVAAISVVAPD